MHEEHSAALVKDKMILAGRIRQVAEEKDILLQSLRTNLDLATQAHHEEVCPFWMFVFVSVCDLKFCYFCSH